MKNKQTHPIRIDEEMTDLPVEAPNPRTPAKVSLTNKAGAQARPLLKDIDAWLAKGWQRET